MSTASLRPSEVAALTDEPGIRQVRLARTLRLLDEAGFAPPLREVLGDEIAAEGDASRRFEPKVNGESYCFAVLNRNKRSISVDLKTAQGREIVMRLAARSDSETSLDVMEFFQEWLGEIGIVGTAAAVANAIFHATGKRVREFPITLDKLL